VCVRVRVCVHVRVACVCLSVCACVCVCVRVCVRAPGTARTETGTWPSPRGHRCCDGHSAKGERRRRLSLVHGAALTIKTNAQTQPQIRRAARHERKHTHRARRAHNGTHGVLAGVLTGVLVLTSTHAPCAANSASAETCVRASVHESPASPAAAVALQPGGNLSTPREYPSTPREHASTPREYLGGPERRARYGGAAHTSFTKGGSARAAQSASALAPMKPTKARRWSARTSRDALTRARAYHINRSTDRKIDRQAER
jgi:hypothetical protein